VLGAVKAVEFGLGPLPATLMGALTGIGGGVIRDLLAGRQPIVFRRELYATPALVGAAIPVVGDKLGLPIDALAVAGAAVCLVLRLLAMWRDWQAPLPRGPASV
jgi:uncharacterized membrane protein YeiH